MNPKWSDLVRWRNLIDESQTEAERIYQSLSPITDEEIKELKSKLKVQLSEEFLSLYLETNGVNEILESEIIGRLIWSSTEIIERNLELRNNPDFKDLYMPFDCLLFFSDDGGGNLFGIPIVNGKCTRRDIFLWNHEDDSRSLVANNLFQFIERRIKGQLDI